MQLSHERSFFLALTLTPYAEIVYSTPFDYPFWKKKSFWALVFENFFVRVLSAVYFINYGDWFRIIIDDSVFIEGYQAKWPFK